MNMQDFQYFFWKNQENSSIFVEIKKIPVFFNKNQENQIFSEKIKTILIFFWKNHHRSPRHATPHHHRINRFRALPQQLLGCWGQPFRNI